LEEKDTRKAGNNLHTQQKATTKAQQKKGAVKPDQYVKEDDLTLA
jgi:hypothetical protein